MEPQNVYIHQNSHFKNLTRRQHFLKHTWVRKRKKKLLKSYSITKKAHMKLVQNVAEQINLKMYMGRLKNRE